MIKKYFRHFVCAVCAALSLQLAFASTPVLNAFAAETTELETEAVSETVTEAQTEAEDAAEEESEETEEPEETEKEEDTEMESESESETEEETEEDTEEETENEAESESEKETESETEEQTESEAVVFAAIEMEQDNDTVTKEDELKQMVTITYASSVDTEITFVPNAAFVLTGIKIDSSNCLIDGTATITFLDEDGDEDEEDITISADMDLSEYDSISKIVFVPGADVENGTIAKFTAVMEVVSEKETATNTLSVVSSDENDSQTIEEKLETKIAYADVTTPTLVAGNDTVEYENSVSVSIGKIGMTSYNETGTLEYTLTIPDFVEVKNIQAPKFNGAASITVYATVNGSEISFGTVASGGTVSVGKTNVSQIRFVVTPEDKTISTVSPGKVTMANNQSSHTEYTRFNFLATTTVTVKNAVYTATSSVTSVTFNAKPAETSAPVETPSTEAPQTETEAPSQTESETETEAETEDTTKAEEAAAKAAILSKALADEEEEQEVQSALLSSRLDEIKAAALSGATSGTSSDSEENISGSSASSTINKSEWVVPPIEESLIDNLVKTVVPAISETIVSNLVPENI